jgi:hypothetical protein
VKPYNTYPLDIDLLYDASLGGYAESNLTMDLEQTNTVGSKSEAELSVDLTYEYVLSDPS